MKDSGIHLVKYFGLHLAGFRRYPVSIPSCLKQLGKGNEYRSHRFVLVAIQVIEQSRDVDFDLIISDITPIDLLLQCSGRRHHYTYNCRPGLLRTPTVWIVEPELDDQNRSEFWVGQYIDDRHVWLQIWLSLRQRNSIQIPEETDALIESVYDQAMPVTKTLEPCHYEHWSEFLATYRNERKECERAIANKVKVPPPGSETELEEVTKQHLEDDERAIAAATRLGQPSITTIFLQETDAGLMLPGTPTLINLRETPDLSQSLDQIFEVIAKSHIHLS